MGSTWNGPTSLRILAGVTGGVVGGLLYGVLMLSQVIAQISAFNDLGLVPFVVDANGGLATWSVHMAASAGFGALFALTFASRRILYTVPAALAFAGAIWAVTSAVHAMDLASLGGHVLFGLGLGAAYPWVWKEELAMLRPAAQPARST